MTPARRYVALLLCAACCTPLTGADSAEDFAKEVRRLQAELGSKFIVEREGNFIIAGNIGKSFFRRVKDGTIKECSDALYKDYFSQKPDHIIRIYLLKDAESYKSYAQKLFGEPPGTKFGFYSDAEKTLIMDISTGTGTLVHEMAHALMHPDFPDAPAWFSEGFASLFEQCRIANGSLVGLVNWRLPYIQSALKNGGFVRFEALMGLSDDEFYASVGKGDNYAEARYLCLYLQKRGLLKKFYKSFRENHRTGKDRTGFTTFKEILGRPVAEFESEWIKWVKRLKWK